MSTFINFRRYDRPDQPQPVYPAVVDAKVRTWAPIWNAELNQVRTGDRPRLDVRQYDWFPDDGWIPKTVDAIVTKWGPVFSSELKSERSPDRTRQLDVRGHEWLPEFTWVRPVVDATVSKWLPAFVEGLRSECTTSRADLDVRGYDWSPPPAWIFKNLPPTVTTAQAWPAILEALGLSYRSEARAAIDVRRYEWAPDDGWVPTVVDTVVRTWLPVFDAEVGERTRDRAALEVRIHEWSPWGWLPQLATDAVVRTWAPIWNAELGERTRDHASLDVRIQEWSAPAWIFSALPVGATVAQVWPALLQALGLSYRSSDRSKLDVRGHEWSPSFGLERVVDATVSPWASIWNAQASSLRSPDRARLDVRQYEWLPSLAWIFQNLTAVTPAQLWPAILQSLGLSYRMADRASLDVRADLWSPEHGWIPKVVEGVLAKYAPVFAAELQTFRSGDRARLDVRGQEWSPEFFGVQRVVDAIVSRYAPVWNAEVGLWTPGRAIVDVRPEWFPDRGWLWTVVTDASALASVPRTQIIGTTNATTSVAEPVVIYGGSAMDLRDGYAAQVLTDGAGHYWKLDNTDGGVTDAVTGTTVAGSANGGVTPGQAGLIGDGRACAFDGLGVGGNYSRLIIAGTAVLPHPSPTFSVEAWINPSDLTTPDGDRYVCHFEGAGRSGIMLTPNLSCVFKIGGVFRQVTGPVITVGLTYHVVVTYDGATLILYVNGLNAGQLACTGTFFPFTTFLMGGSEDFVGGGLAGSLDEVSVNSAPLTAAQVARHYALGPRVESERSRVTGTVDLGSTAVGTV